jgi:hypothetical protein
MVLVSVPVGMQVLLSAPYLWCEVIRMWIIWSNVPLIQDSLCRSTRSTEWLGKSFRVWLSREVLSSHQCHRHSRNHNFSTLAIPRQYFSERRPIEYGTKQQQHLAKQCIACNVLTCLGNDNVGSRKCQLLCTQRLLWGQILTQK